MASTEDHFENLTEDLDDGSCSKEQEWYSGWIAGLGSGKSKFKALSGRCFYLITEKAF